MVGGDALRHAGNGFFIFGAGDGADATGIGRAAPRDTLRPVAHHFGTSVAASITTATAVPGGADRSNSPLSLPLSMAIHA